MALMPLNRDTKAHLRAHYLQLYVDAGGVLVVVVQFLCTCNLFVSRLVQESRSSKKCRPTVDHLSKGPQQSVSAHAQCSLFCRFR
jgi:hypothetical protein